MSGARAASSTENARSAARPKLFSPSLSQYSAMGVNQPVSLVSDARRLERQSAIRADSSCASTAAAIVEPITAARATSSAAAREIKEACEDIGELYSLALAKF